MPAEPIRRRFADLPHGQIHYREAGQGRGNPVLLLHSSPGSSRQLERLIASLAADHHVIAPDTPGNGDSTPLPAGEIADLAAALHAFLDVIGLPAAHVHGTHTGAAIAAELAIRAPARVRTLALDGVSLLEGEALATFLERYAPDFAPDLEGSHLARAFQFCRDQFLFFPWYERTAAASRGGGLPSASDLDALVVEVLKSGRSYAANYHAAFRWEARTRLPLVACPLLLMASTADPLFEATRTVAGDAHRFLALPRFDEPDHAAARKAALAALFGEVR